MDKSYYFIYDGNPSYDYMTMSDYAEISAPEPIIESFEIPGRNGDLHFFTGNYRNRNIKIKGFVKKGSENIENKISAINSWILGSGSGYKEFSTSYDENHFMLARAFNGARCYNVKDQINAFELEFSARPERFLYSGLTAISMNVPTPTSTIAATDINNPTAFTSKPIIEITGSFEELKIMTFTSTLKVSVAGNETIQIDCETGMIISPTGSYNSKIIDIIGDFELESGNNRINIELVSGANVDSVKIIPRWWEL